MSKLPEIEYVDKETGEILRSNISDIYSYQIKGAANKFILYFAVNLTSLYGIKVHKELLNEILIGMNHDNIIHLHSFFKRKVKDKIKLSIPRIEYWIRQFVEQNILMRIDRGTYVVNPYLWGKGSIDKIMKMRVQYDALRKDLLIEIERNND